eukprot:2074579-Amphidinium_carterae.1
MQDTAGLAYFHTSTRRQCANDRSVQKANTKETKTWGSKSLSSEPDSIPTCSSNNAQDMQP